MAQLRAAGVRALHPGQLGIAVVVLCAMSFTLHALGLNKAAASRLSASAALTASFEQHHAIQELGLWHTSASDSARLSARARDYGQASKRLKAASGTANTASFVSHLLSPIPAAAALILAWIWFGGRRRSPEHLST